jgi:hypothetical protein
MNFGYYLAPYTTSLTCGLFTRPHVFVLTGTNLFIFKIYIHESDFIYYSMCECERLLQRHSFSLYLVQPYHPTQTYCAEVINYSKREKQLRIMCRKNQRISHSVGSRWLPEIIFNLFKNATDSADVAPY